MNLEDYKQELGKVTKVFFGIEDHGILSFGINFDFGGIHQGTGMHSLSWTPRGQTRPRGMIHGTDLICAMLSFFGVEKLEDIEDQVVYVLRDKDKPHGDIKGFLRTPFDGSAHFLFKEWREEVKVWEQYVKDHDDGN